MPTYVPAEGNVNSHIMIIGEAPGETEERLGKPFVGQAGRVLDGLLDEAGIKREDCYISNVYKYRPRNNIFASIPKEELAKAYSELEEEIMLTRPNVIVLLGNEPMRAVLGHAGVSYYRGSVLESKYGKCIPTYHPAAIAREWSYRPISVLDWHKIKKESVNGNIQRVARHMAVHPSFDSVIAYCNAILRDSLRVSFDIEVETQQVNCISLAISPVDAMSIPFWYGSSGSFWSEEQELEIWAKLKELLENPSIPKIAQNAQYDMTILRDKCGVVVRGLWVDTMVAFHSVYPELPKGLDLLCSIYTDVPYYKYLRNTDDMTKFFEYNAMDALVTYECAEKIYEEMQEFKVESFYYEHMHSLIEPLLDITSRGVRVDTSRKAEVTKELKAIVLELQSQLGEAVGHELNTNSPKQMKEWLYDELKLPKQYKLRKGKGEKTVAADEEALETLYRSTKLEALKLVLAIREHQKILSTYLETTYDKEKKVYLHKDETGHITVAREEIVERARTSYLITGTETGRLSSRETVYGTGTNMQNIPKGIVRRLFIPDPGKIFVNADLSQAEARVVAFLAEEARLMRVFQEGGDIHRKNAANIFKKAPEEVTKEERELAKRIVHACLAKDTEVLTKEGWRNIASITTEDYIAEWEPLDKTIEFRKPKNIFSYETPKTMLEFKCGSFHQKVTHNHKMPYMTNGVVKAITAEYMRSSYRLPTSGYLYQRDGGSNLTQVEIQLCAAIQADASMRKDRFCFRLKKERKIARLAQLLQTLQITPTVSIHADGATCIRFTWARWSELLDVDKTFGSKVLTLNAPEVECLIKEVILWDGHQGKTYQVYYTGIKKNALWVQVAAHLCGWQARLHAGCRCWRVQLSKREYVRCPEISARRGCGKVYCLGTSSGYFIIKSQGKISVTGNSNYGMGPITFAKNAGVSVASAKHLLNAYFAEYPRIKLWHMGVASALRKSRTITTPLGRKRTFFNLYNEGLLKEAFAFTPQSTVADILNMGLRRLYAKEKEIGCEILLQIHDAVLCQCAEANVQEVARAIKETLTIPVEIGTATLTIPVDVSTGYNWEDLKKL